MDYLRNVFGKNQIKLLIIGGISVIAGLIVTLLCVSLSGSLKAENMASRWSDDDNYAQVSVYLSELADFTDRNVNELAFSIERRLKEDSITANENARLWIKAYSSWGKVSVVSKAGNASVKALGVGGDFFLFHPMNIIAGSGFSDDNTNDDLAIIDRETAWTLFGSTDVVGQQIEVNGERIIISGVIDRDEGRLNRLAGNDEPIIYLSYSKMAEFGYEKINMYEALIPNPISNYAYGLISDGLGSDDRYFEIVQNTGRFFFTKLLKNVTKFGTRGMNSKGIVYPYWENMARGMEDYLTPLAVLGFIAFLFPAIVLVYILGRMWKLRPIHKEDIKDYIERLIEKGREKRLKKKESLE